MPLRRLVLLASLAAASFTASSCGTSNRIATEATAQTPLRFGLFAAGASGADGERRLRYEPVVSYLQSHLARPVQLTVTQNAAGVLAAFEDGALDVVFSRAIAFPHAHERVGAIPLVSRLEDRNVTTVFVAAARDPRQTLHDFKGARFDFSLRAGSSYVMGRRHLERLHIAPETFFGQIHYSSVADEALERLHRGEADLAVANSGALVRVLASGAIDESDLKVVAETEPHVGQLWFAATALPPATRLAIRDAFLDLSPSDPAHAPVLRLLSASGFVPATADDYRELTELMRKMDLLDFDIRQLP